MPGAAAAASGSSVDPFRCLFMAASADKEDMICLNDRLGDVVLKVDKLRAGSTHDSSTFLRTIDCLKDEIRNIKTAYDQELSRLRRALMLYTIGAGLRPNRA